MISYAHSIVLVSLIR